MYNNGIAGYTYRADTYCTSSECIARDLATGPGQEFDGWALAPGIDMQTEANLSEIAHAFGIERDDEYSFDSDYFPKVVMSWQVESDTCTVCGVDL